MGRENLQGTFVTATDGSFLGEHQPVGSGEAQGHTARRDRVCLPGQKRISGVFPTNGTKQEKA